MGRALLSLASSVLAAACATTDTRSDREPERTVVEVEVRNPGDIDVDELVEGLSNHPPSGIVFREYAEFHRGTLALDQQRIEAFYKARGYYSTRILRVDVREVQDEGVAITFVLDPGARTLLEAIAFEGVPSDVPVDDEWIRRETALRIGKPFRYDQYAEATRLIEAVLLSRGYAFAEIDTRVAIDRDKLSARVEYTLLPGPRARFGKIEVQGLVKLPESFVRNRLAFQAGDLFSPVVLEETRGRLYTSGLVGSVRYAWDRARPSESVDVVVEVTEGTRHEIRLGAGVEIDQLGLGVRGRASYLHKGFLDPLLTLRVEAQPAYSPFGGNAGQDFEANVEVIRHDFMLRLVELTTGVRYRFTELEAYSTLGPSARFHLGRPFRRHRFVLGLGLEGHFLTMPTVAPEIPESLRPEFGIFERLDFGFVEPSIVYDARDNPRDPHLGYYLRLHAQAGFLFSGAKDPFVTVGPEARGYLPLGSRVVLASRVRVESSLFGLGALPATQRYFAGGAESHRGFVRRRLAEFVEGGDSGTIPVGGEALLETNAEVRISVIKLWGDWLGIAAFLDGADVRRRLSDIDVLKLHWAAGGGLRYHTPIGAIRADIGFRLNRTGPGEPDPNGRFAVHVSLGEAF